MCGEIRLLGILMTNADVPDANGIRSLISIPEIRGKIPSRSKFSKRSFSASKSEITTPGNPVGIPAASLIP